ncbi:Ankyrin-repeat protein [Orpheovirus IHUMI-LCC2]|uniref:Ankyrin-repeat protein n=1 Tax=Orpheovirus IHUMI-LCC2 TaxID=2023057 RepID=A0A2I2L4C3_9VIRU|nr:Ankyrin-repeat protein [Orpheovirus IHUMI-LCC2]SNW62361.1 Ankyrin-repeat protein [Orpheovirus IHUMI-LCC2]
MNSITEDVFNYLINTFLSKEERTILRLVNTKYRSKYADYVNIKTLLKNNNIETIKSLIIEYPIKEYVIYQLIDCGNVELLEWLFCEEIKTINWKRNLYNLAISTGDIKVLEWINNNICIPFSDNNYNYALECGNLDVIKWFHSKYISKRYHVFVSSSDGYKWNIETFEWVMNTHTITQEGYRSIIYNYDLTVYLLENYQDIKSYDLYKEILTCAIIYEDFKLLKLMKNEIIRYDINNFLWRAVRVGNLPIMKYLYKNGRRLNSRNLLGRIHIDNAYACIDTKGIDTVIDIMKWLLNPEEKEGIVRDEINACCWSSFSYAKVGYNFKIIKWLMDAGCPLPSENIIIDTHCFVNNIEDIIKNYHMLDILKIDMEENIRYNGILLLTMLCKKGDMNSIKWFMDKGFFNYKKSKKKRKTKIIKNACKSGNLDLVIWLYNNGYGYDKKCCKKAISYGHVNILEWIKEQGLEIAYSKKEMDKHDYISKRGYDWAKCNNLI